MPGCFVPQTELASEGVLADLVTMFLGSLRLGRPTPPWATGGHRRPRPAAPPPPSGSRSPQPGVRKTWFCLGNGSKIEMRGNPATQMDCMVPRMCLDVPVSPQTPPNPSFWAISQFSGILGRAPGHPLLALCGPIGPISPVWGPVPGLYYWLELYNGPAYFLSWRAPAQAW